MSEPIWIEAQSLAHDRAAHAFFTRDGGVSTGVYQSLNGGVGSRDKPAAVNENRERMARALGVGPERLLVPFQIHSCDALAVERPWAPEDRPRCDALATSTPGLALGITGADCGMVLFHDRAAGVIGAAHAGWKGALGGVLESTLAAMERLGAHRGQTRAALGPMIGGASYEVGPEFVATFQSQDSGNSAFFTARPGSDRSLFDLPAFIGARLARAGLGEFENIGLDTYDDEARFFSYRRSQHRREGDYGRLVAAIVLK